MWHSPGHFLLTARYLSLFIRGGQDKRLMEPFPLVISFHGLSIFFWQSYDVTQKTVQIHYARVHFKGTSNFMP